MYISVLLCERKAEILCVRVHSHYVSEYRATSIHNYVYPNSFAKKPWPRLKLALERRSIKEVINHSLYL